MLAEIKALSKPPQLVMNVMEAAMILIGQDPSWINIKK
tara:strand:+ start:167 stop:280 length:114 start_codon:yes stop_codon:yes gene_type:complete